MKGATAAIPILPRPQIFQSTLPRRERQQLLWCISKLGVISIHAPAKGATGHAPCQSRISLDFNPRSREGSDTLAQCTHIGQTDFNPRSREGSDALPRAPSFDRVHFNPRSREGSDPAPPVRLLHPRVFQSTLPRRERLGNIRFWIMVANFNPRSREGSDQPVRSCLKINQQFQSTLPRRERPPLRRFADRCAADFNPRSREGSDHLCTVLACNKQYFNPRSREGSDTPTKINPQAVYISIHAPEKGATKDYELDGDYASFQSTLPRRERHLPNSTVSRVQNFNPRSREGSDDRTCRHKSNA